MAKNEINRYSELAHFLRNRRERLTPKQAGLPEAGRRRTPGLRRGEVAMLAGVSLEWYTYLEQGRSIHVSAEVLEGLAVALQLDAAERKHMFLLAHRQPPPEQSRAQSEVSPVLQRFLDSQGLNPACAMDARMNIVAWNEAMYILNGDLSKVSEKQRNLLWGTFTSADFRKMKGSQWEEHARRTVAQFRADYARYGDDPWWGEQVLSLSELSEEFRTYWEQHDVLDYSHAHKIMQHPVVGELAFDYISFQPLDKSDLQISIHIPLDDGITKNKIQKFLEERS
ncbi:helix-turn-helix transcriptional regulator [Paenibacillus radicis (ex Gao et al. 2016)]|uniref:Transcriptional regulator n=1 Tax=Paenibacillus radicis (ex Gao et al. 2016) TaxID=1737354 RepID=A0A917HFQ5_9BACL|nr:helix-turn-helix transcriptional regulator [Paenibacillus radicis (ex Gao et al. 2016)]GGG77506.1 transcriptional regulator [Paenibacillus radicis (ex Gao et al. 2016)]